MTTPKKKAIKKQIKKNNDIPVVDVYSLSGKKVDKFKLDPDVFNAEIRKGLLHQTVVMHMANRRQGNASTKTRAHISGGGKKPWKQKGTGRARAGSIRSPLWRGGGVVFGPHPRDFGFTMPKTSRNVAIISGLSAKTRDSEIMILEKDLVFEQPKTKEMAKILTALKLINKKSLLIYSNRDENLLRACKNIKSLSLRLYSDFNTTDVLLNARILFSKETHDNIVKRLKK
ncbi:MAG: 50S ribosomal protein L4 [Candidatus Omnitrophica bacterium]|nr:50S ribosomal protein L4 [Candidatus Omnitrophota bacterium]